jgi:hypothetical protein
MNAEKKLGSFVISAVLAALPFGCSPPSQEASQPSEVTSSSEPDAPEASEQVIHEEDFESGDRADEAVEPEAETEPEPVQ